MPTSEVIFSVLPPANTARPATAVLVPSSGAAPLSPIVNHGYPRSPDLLNNFSDFFLSLLTHLSLYEIIHVSQIWIAMLGIPDRFVVSMLPGSLKIINPSWSLAHSSTIALKLIRVGFLVRPSIRRMNHEIRPMCGLRLCRSLVYTFNPKVVSRFHFKRDEFDRFSRNVGISTTGNKRKVWSRPSPSRFLDPCSAVLSRTKRLMSFSATQLCSNVFGTRPYRPALTTRCDCLSEPSRFLRCRYTLPPSHLLS